MIGLLTPDKGLININQVNILKASHADLMDLKKKYGVLFQMSALFDSLSVYENISFMLRRFTDKKESEIREIVKEKLALVGLKDIEDKKPVELSGGIQKRIGLARAIALNPEIVFYDEPTTSVDPISATAIDNLILSLNQKLNVTSVIISHDMNSVFRVAHRVAFLYNNHFEMIGTPNDFKVSDNKIVKQFISGDSKVKIPINK